MRLMRPSTGTDISPSATPSVAILLNRIKQTNLSVLAWWGLALSILCSTFIRFSTESTGVLFYTGVILGSGGCAWFWLLSRSLFRSKKELHSGMIYVVPVVILVEAIAALMSPVGGVAGTYGEVGRIFVNAASMVCVASIVFVYNETLNGFNQFKSTAEKRFRLVFIGSFSLVVVVATVWVSGAGSGTFAAKWSDALLTACAVLALVASRTAVQYRLLNPVHKVKRPEGDKVATESLSKRILKAIEDDGVLTTPNLKVAAFAALIKEQEYKVTRCITNHLQYRNFNHLLNTHRIERAKHIFNDPNSSHLTIATIAYDCGFNSLGPFNRAFRQYIGLTPTEFRKQQSSA